MAKTRFFSTAAPALAGILICFASSMATPSLCPDQAQYARRHGAPSHCVGNRGGAEAQAHAQSRSGGSKGKYRHRRSTPSTRTRPYLRTSPRACLREFGKAFKEDIPGVPVIIEGHADPRGGEEYNLELSRRRAGRRSRLSRRPARR